MVAFSYMGKLIECKRVNDRTQASLVSLISEVRKPLMLLVQRHMDPIAFKGAVPFHIPTRQNHTWECCCPCCIFIANITEKDTFGAE